MASADIKTLIKTHKVGAVILFLRNISTATQLIELTSSLQAIAASAGQEQDLFIAIDQENWLVTRIKPPVAAQLPGSMALGATGDVANAFKVASATGNRGVLPCVKHFPSHGDTAVDSHFSLPVISKNRAELDLCELVPFRRAVVEGVESVMAAHVAMPGIGEHSLGEDHPSTKLPASLNPDAIKI